MPLDFDRLGADVDVRRLDRVDDRAQRNIVVAQLVGIDFDLVLTHVAADRRHFGHAVDAIAERT